MPSSSSGCGCHGGGVAARAPLAATLSTAGSASHHGHAVATGVSAGGAPPPMEMLGGGGGISVVDPATVLTRLWWFDGRFLRADGFRVDQEYLRNLVGLSNQAVGTGVVHGFDTDLLGSGTVRVEAGLALAPSGRVVHLPSSTDLSIAELVARSTGTFDPARHLSGAGPEFAPCPPDAPAPTPDQSIATSALHVLTVASAEALCGEEERFGQLCGDACAADADRSVAVEGVRFRVRQVSLELPTSTRVPFTGRHLRSRAASAYYAAERRAVASTVSGVGLRGPVWCDGAAPAGGDEVPLAVLDRAGGLTSFLDGWVARRELVETTPQRYWQWRTARRPLDVFLAQVLQFQCQLADVPQDGGGPGGQDPCAEERTVLGDVQALLSDLGEGRDEQQDAVLEKLRLLRGRVTDVLATQQLSPTGSLLVDHGIVETPSAGYLPVVSGRDVRQQAAAWFGQGVDLRLCAVRPDFVPEAFQEAQHMERISLTRGIDDPALLEEVDVLVPGGTFATASTDTAFAGRLDVLPDAFGDDLEVEAAAVTLRAVARDQVSDGWSWTLAAYGELPHRLGVEEYTRALRDAVTSRTEGPVDVHREAVRTQLRNLSGAAARILREGSLARARVGRGAGESQGRRVASEALRDVAVLPDERRPLVAWADLQTERPLDTLEVGAASSVRVRLTSYSRAKSPSVADLLLTGTLTVTDRRTEPGTDGTPVIRVGTALDGSLEAATEELGQHVTYDVRGSSLVWRLGRSVAGVRLLGAQLSLSVEGEEQPLELSARFSDGGAPRTAEGRAVTGRDVDGVNVDGGLRAPLAVVTLEERTGVLDVGTSGLDLASTVIDVLGTALTALGRGAGFREHARARLLPTRTGEATITSDADWVMFHRRRTKDCGLREHPPTPTRLLRYRWLHSFVRGDDQREAVGPLTHASGAAADDSSLTPEQLMTLLRRFPPQPVGLVEYEEGAALIRSSAPALRAAWTGTERGARMPVAVTGRWGVGEGAVVEGARLAAATSVVSDLVDTRDLRAFVMPQAPEELKSEGTDGVFVTFGLAVPAPQLSTTSFLVRANVDQYERMRELLPQLSRFEEVRRFCDEIGVETFELRFVDDGLENADDLRQWWGANGVKRMEVAFDRALPPGSAEAERWMAAKAPKVTDALGFPDAPDVVPHVAIELEGHEALLVAQPAG